MFAASIMTLVYSRTVLVSKWPLEKWSCALQSSESTLQPHHYI